MIKKQKNIALCSSADFFIWNTKISQKLPAFEEIMGLQPIFIERDLTKIRI